MKSALFHKFQFFIVICIFMTLHARADLDFGNNKVRYHTDHHWKILESQHFEIYYYKECEAFAHIAVQCAENAFVNTCKVFDYVPINKIPLFLYGTGLEFQETNITPEILSEGVGGFTEIFKNRISVPINGSYYEFEKVLHHELTHAFQYDLIYGESWRSINLFKSILVPTWMMEGMAEWNAQHLDGQGEMVLRDAILNDQVLPLNILESFDHFEQVYMAYKESQSILDYISQLYGSEIVAQIFKKMAVNQSPDTAVKNTIGISLDELYENWHFFIKSQTWSRINGLPTPEKYGELIEKGATKATVSPDEIAIAYIKGEDLILYNLSSKTKKVLTHKKFETQGSGIVWSPNGNYLAFSAARNGEYKLSIIEIKNRKIQEFNMPKLPIIYSPSWSPDQRYIIFSAFDYSTVDLYRLEFSTGKIERLTNNLITKSWATYSQDGKVVYFLGEDSGETKIYRMNLNEKGFTLVNPEIVGKDLATISSFQVMKDSIYFTSNRNNRIFNLFKMNLNGDQLTQLTNTYVDVLSVAPLPNKKVFVTLYQHAQVGLYSFLAEKLDQNTQPPINLKYLANSFENASKILANNPTKNLIKKDETKEKMNISTLEDSQNKKEPEKTPEQIRKIEVTDSSNIVQLQWPVTTVEGGAEIDNYRIYRSTDSGQHFIFLGSTSNSRDGKYTDYNVKKGESYFYYVTAINKKGESLPSPIVPAIPTFNLSSRDYQFKFTPDILLLLAGYDSSAGFVGGGIAQFSDYLGDNRLSLIGDTVPGVETGIQTNYEFSPWRTTIDLNYYYFQNYLNIYDLQTGNIVNQYRNNENGMDLNFSYPLDSFTRFEYGIGTQRFQGNPLYLQFSEGISNYSLNSDLWNVANYYRISLVEEKRKGERFWPSNGYAFNFTLLHALPVLDSNVSFANILFETQVFADINFLNHLVWANRIIGMTSQGPNPQSFFIGNDELFQAYFTTIRGYGNKTFFGSNLALLNTELRYPIANNMNFLLQPLSFVMIKDIELAGFVDNGIMADQLQNMAKSPLLCSIGTGLRFYTFLYQRALVMLRFDVAWRLDGSYPPTFHFNLAPIF